MENSDPPPPYPELEAGDRFTDHDDEQTSTVLPLAEKDLAAHPHQHVLLATTSNVFPAAIHFWTRAEENSPTYSLRSVQTRLGSDRLALVQGFRELGEGHLRDPLINRHETVARFLESMVASAPAAASSDSEGLLAWIQEWLASLGTIQESSLAPQEPTAAAVKVVAIPVFSNS